MEINCRYKYTYRWYVYIYIYACIFIYCPCIRRADIKVLWHHRWLYMFICKKNCEMKKKLVKCFFIFELTIDKWFRTYGLWSLCVVYQIFIPIKITAMKYQQNNFVDGCHQNIKNCIKKINSLGTLRTVILECQHWCPLFDITF